MCGQCHTEGLKMLTSKQTVGDKHPYRGSKGQKLLLLERTLPATCTGLIHTQAPSGIAGSRCSDHPTCLSQLFPVLVS